MTTFTGEQRSEGYENTKWQNIYISPSVNPSKKEDWYQVIDTRKSWRNNDQWTRIIKREGVRISFAKKSQMSSFDREVEIYINHHYPLPQND